MNHPPRFDAGQTSALWTLQKNLKNATVAQEAAEKSLTQYQATNVSKQIETSRSVTDALRVTLIELGDAVLLVEGSLHILGPATTGALVRVIASTKRAVQGAIEDGHNVEQVADGERSCHIQYHVAQEERFDIVEDVARMFEAAHAKAAAHTDELENVCQWSRSYVKCVMAERLKWQQQHGANPASLRRSDVSFVETCRRTVTFLDRTDGTVTRPGDTAATVTDRFLPRMECNQDPTYVSPQQELMLLRELLATDDTIGLVKEIERLSANRATGGVSMDTLRRARDGANDVRLMLRDMRESVLVAYTDFEAIGDKLLHEAECVVPLLSAKLAQRPARKKKQAVPPRSLMNSAGMAPKKSGVSPTAPTGSAFESAPQSAQTSAVFTPAASTALTVGLADTSSASAAVLTPSTVSNPPPPQRNSLASVDPGTHVARGSTKVAERPEVTHRGFTPPPQQSPRAQSIAARVDRVERLVTPHRPMTVGVKLDVTPDATAVPDVALNVVPSSTPIVSLPTTQHRSLHTAPSRVVLSTKIVNDKVQNALKLTSRLERQSSATSERGSTMRLSSASAVRSYRPTPGVIGRPSLKNTNSDTVQPHPPPRRPSPMRDRAYDDFVQWVETRDA
jgi:hypothetical protein